MSSFTTTPFRSTSPAPDRSGRWQAMTRRIKFALLVPAALLVALVHPGVASAEVRQAPSLTCSTPGLPTIFDLNSWDSTEAAKVDWYVYDGGWKYAASSEWVDFNDWQSSGAFTFAYRGWVAAYVHIWDFGTNAADPNSGWARVVLSADTYSCYSG
jgi:hypothetical protein